MSESNPFLLLFSLADVPTATNQRICNVHLLVQGAAGLRWREVGTKLPSQACMLSGCAEQFHLLDHIEGTVPDEAIPGVPSGQRSSSDCEWPAIGRIYTSVVPKIDIVASMAQRSRHQ
uniref:Uncharacterized protein n=1 Tax=Arundo donax TaxID=35708 RepID=A0A0A9BFB0_ARUDO